MAGSPSFSIYLELGLNQMSGSRIKVAFENSPRVPAKVLALAKKRVKHSEICQQNTGRTNVLPVQILGPILPLINASSARHL